MPTEFAFRLSTFLTLGLACAGLGYAEREYLPEISVLAGLVVAALVVLFRAGDRFDLSLKAANRVGLVIAAVTVGWLAYQFGNRNSLINTFPWPASLLPCLGPLLLVLIPAKLSRPKHVGDWWAMQGIGLVAIGLASALSEDEVSGVILAVYTVAAVSALTLFYYRRSAGTLTPPPNTDPGPIPVVLTPGWAAGPGSPARAAVRRSVGWLAAAVVVSLPLFFLTPRSDAPPWQFNRGNLETGYGTDQMIDLNRTGDLRANREVAYEVRATYPDGRPKEDLSPNQRWRGSGFHVYDGGRWGRSAQSRLLQQMAAPPLAFQEADQVVPPDFGPGRYELAYTPKVKGADPVLADPVSWIVGGPSPVWTITPSDRRQWRQQPDGSFQTGRRGDDSLPWPHRQFVRPQNERFEDMDLGSPFELGYPLQLPDPDPSHLLSKCTEIKLPRVRTFAVELLDRLAAGNPVLKAARDRLDTRVSFQLAPQDFEPVARAFSRHLSESGEYTYTTALRRTDKNVDPVEEFLLRTKAGHCERYAAGLAILLRSLGVPTVYVLGYKGCEYDGNGVYLIRQEFAHAWVEVLVPRPPPPGFPFAEQPPGAKPKAEVWHWLSLDPTPPGGEDASADTVGGWLDGARETWAAFFTDFIVGYNPQRRQQAVDAATAWLERWAWTMLAIPAAVAAVLVVRFTRRRWDRAARLAGNGGSGFPWFDRLSEVLREHGLAGPPGATPREAAEAAGAALCDWPDVADVPREVTRAFYLARYADRPPAPDELTALTADVDRLRAALRSAKGRP